jgi:hypothetical protein
VEASEQKGTLATLGADIRVAEDLVGVRTLHWKQSIRRCHHLLARRVAWEGAYQMRPAISLWGREFLHIASGV